VSSRALPLLHRSLMTTCMAKLNGLAWAAGLSLEAHGVRIGVRLTDPSALDEIRACLPLGWKTRASPRVDHLVSLVVGDREKHGTIRRLHLVYSGALRALRTAHWSEALDFLQYHLEEYVAQMAPAHVFVHAGVVAWKGRAMLVPGRSHSGKTSLVAALLAAGATYYSDEFAVLDAQGRVLPYLRPLRLRRGSDDRGAAVPPEALGARRGRQALPVQLVAATHYEAGRRWRPRRLSQGEAVLEMLAHTVPARFRPREVLDVLGRVALRAEAFKGRRGEARDTAQALLSAME